MITEEMIRSDKPTSETLGRLFEQFCATENGQTVIEPLRNDYGDHEFVLRNRCRRAFEAGFAAAQQALFTMGII